RFNITPVVVDDATIEAVFEAFRRDPVKDIQAWCLHHRPDFGLGVKFLCNTDPQVLENMTNGQNNVIIEVAKLNNIRYINKYFNKINELLPPGGVFIACCQTSLTRKQNILKKKLFPFNYFLYTFDFLWHRVLPKIKYLRTFYFNITQGKHRVFPHTEILGRLYSCGFEVCKEEVIHKLFYVAVRKTKAPYYDKQPTYGLFIRLKRIGKNGELISVFKFRTMHAYSEYLQPYIYQKNNLKEGGKFADDFRISSWGRFLRTCWLDEFPMLVNLLKGEMKLVGVRPLSPHYFSLYTPEMQALRIKVKPGLLPPFYSGDKPQTIEEVQENERTYIEAYLKNPLRTDWKYFWKIVWNIVFKRKRSE
ncbi:MAG: sugar transferase, partial [Acidimicrobiia bacterium]